jgi:ABC-type multidrug transport system, ATPase and permease components
MNTNPDIEDDINAIELINPKGNIVFKDVSFSYNDKYDVLKNVNIKIPAGKTIALVGPSGGGKTTFCSLIPRFYEINEGSITIDNQDIRDIKLNYFKKFYWNSSTGCIYVCRD